MFKDDGIAQSPALAAHHPSQGGRFPAKQDQTALIDRLFEANGWCRSWRDSIYDFVHYHSQVHELLGVARGEGVVEFGGVKGKRLTLCGGDIAILPAGTGHRLLEASRNFLVVGAYPPTGIYDERTDRRDRPDAIEHIAKVKKPPKDPVYGAKSGRPFALEHPLG
jgi:uncharacterized protein YjlB